MHTYIHTYIQLSHTFTSLTMNEMQNNKNIKIFKSNILMFTKSHTFMLNKVVPLHLHNHLHIAFWLGAQL